MAEKRSVRVLRLPHGKNFPLPHYATALSAGLDLVAAIETPYILAAGGRGLIATGICIELPADMEAQVRPRSGLAVKFGITVLNAPGTVDADYRGEIKVCLFNSSIDAFTVNPGDRIAQLVISPVIQVNLEETSELSETLRGTGGFGSTGISNQGTPS